MRFDRLPVALSDCLWALQISRYIIRTSGRFRLRQQLQTHSPDDCNVHTSAATATLQENAFNYDKGVLAEILEPIMGKGLIPADLETWKPRRRAIVPAFHKAYLEAMVKMFGRCTEVAVDKLDAIASSSHVS